MWILFIYWTRWDAYMYITCFQYKIQLHVIKNTQDRSGHPIPLWEDCLNFHLWNKWFQYHLFPSSVKCKSGKDVRLGLSYSIDPPPLCTTSSLYWGAIPTRISTGQIYICWHWVRNQKLLLPVKSSKIYALARNL